VLTALEAEDREEEGEDRTEAVLTTKAQEAARLEVKQRRDKESFYLTVILRLH
jgi:hypothetical protein